MALAISVTKSWFDGQRQHVKGVITPTGNYATPGDTLAFTGAAAHKIKSVRTPEHCQINGRALDHVYLWVPGATAALGKMKVAVRSTGLELADAAYPAAITSDVIEFYAIFRTR